MLDTTTPIRDVNVSASEPPLSSALKSRPTSTPSPPSPTPAPSPTTSPSPSRPSPRAPHRAPLTLPPSSTTTSYICSLASILSFSGPPLLLAVVKARYEYDVIDMAPHFFRFQPLTACGTTSVAPNYQRSMTSHHWPGSWASHTLYEPNTPPLSIVVLAC
ncbi:hypothetical protein DFH08DRAFT_251364 [Mycena albidolilacea]|uniref:Uncharacterized protein n=1 Tax=Mycena albidolilacea TaxID=1033008 RepID=A0AAD6ZTW2_9AGAR|nr:hypothetical protein DFH08DRAFT_251364 [Mycena albidolilacea]